jgi:hypothetical protein
LKEVFMADEDDLEARKARAEAIHAQISKIVGPRKSDGGERTDAENGQGKILPRRVPGVLPSSPREFIEGRMRELDSPKDIEPSDSKKD